MVGFIRDRVGAVVVAVIAMSVAAAQADVLFVDGNNCPGPGDGSELDPYCSIQTAIDNAVDTDEIVVAPGTYFETINFLGKAITLRSSGGLEVTIIDGTGNLHVVQCVSGEGPDTVLDGFTITGGNATGDFPDNSGGGMRNDGSSPTVLDCAFIGNSAEIGGGMFNYESGPTVSNCTFSDNAEGGMTNWFGSPTATDCSFTDNDGGGMQNARSSPTVIDCSFTDNDGGGMQNARSSPTVIDCTFTDNLGSGMRNALGSPTVIGCTFSGNSAGSGGGMYNLIGSPTVIGCTFSGNSAGGGGGMYNNGSSNPMVTECSFSENSAFSGGGMHNSGSPILANCTFHYNTASRGGGMYNSGDGSPTITNCVFGGNQSIDGVAAPCGGGGMFNAGNSSPAVINSTFSGNAAECGGGGMYNNGNSSPAVTNCTFSQNSAVVGGGMFSDLSSPTVTNCILWNDSPDEFSGTGLATVTYSNVQGSFPGTGNIDADPLFVDPLNGDFRLSPGSPCIDAGNNWGVSPDFADLDEDGDTTELTPLDLDSNPRFVHASAQHPGCGEPAIVDMGPYEFQDGKAADIKLGDIDGDGTVNIVDLLILLARWGACEPGCCLPDLDLDGDVGITDLLILLGSWG